MVQPESPHEATTTKYHGTSSLEVDGILANGFYATDTPFLTDLAEARDWAQMRVENRQWRKAYPVLVENMNLLEQYIIRDEFAGIINASYNNGDNNG